MDLGKSACLPAPPCGYGKDSLEREFYLHATTRFGWATKELPHHLDSPSDPQSLNSQTNFDAAVPDSSKACRRRAALSWKPRATTA